MHIFILKKFMTYKSKRNIYEIKLLQTVCTVEYVYRLIKRTQLGIKKSKTKINKNRFMRSYIDIV